LLSSTNRQTPAGPAAAGNGYEEWVRQLRRSIL
jgi:hypothetical protein